MFLRRLLRFGLSPVVWKLLPSELLHAVLLPAKLLLELVLPSQLLLAEPLSTVSKQVVGS